MHTGTLTSHLTRPHTNPRNLVTEASQLLQRFTNSSTSARQSSFICLKCRLQSQQRTAHTSYPTQSKSGVQNLFQYQQKRLIHSTGVLAQPDPLKSQSGQSTSEKQEGADTSTDKHSLLQNDAEQSGTSWAPPAQAVSIEPDRTSSHSFLDEQQVKSPKPPPGPKSTDQPTLAIRIHQLSNQIVDSLTRIAHRLNIYTGTDYTPIQTIRDSIKSQEHSLRSRHEDVAGAKSTHSAALKSQRTQQKEVVQLLERKHSWSDGDMERYMGLIRSEHVNERAVESAAREVSQAERALEEARQELERSERKMYHEEQVWSDTIRRNSTWITFGLMSLNVLLLLTQIVIVEPWRRRRLIREMRGALDEKNVVTPAAIKSLGVAAEAAEADAATTTEGAAVPQAELEGEVDAATPPATEAIAEAETPSLEDLKLDAASQAPATLSIVPGDELDELPPNELPTAAFAHLTPHPFSSKKALFSSASWRGVFERFQLIIQDLFSERVITMRHIDLTAKRLESAALGVMLSGMALLIGILTLED